MGNIFSRASKSMDIAAAVAEKSGWSRTEALKKMREARKRIGIDFATYEKFDFHALDEKQQKEKYEEILRLKDLNKSVREDYIQKIMEKSGKDRDEVVATLKEVKEKYDISAAEYYKHHLYRFEGEEVKVQYDEAKNGRKERDDAVRMDRVREVTERTGWDFDTALEKMTEAKERTGCAFKEYLHFGFYDMDEELQNDVFVIADSKALSKKYNVDTKLSNILLNKDLANSYFDEYLRRKWCVNTEISKEEFCSRFKGSKRIIYKPVAGHRGEGIRTYRLKEDNLEEVYEKLAKRKKGIVEEYVVQHEEMLRLSPGAVNTLRIVTVSSSSFEIPGTDSHVAVAYSSLRIGGGKAVVDNFHQGGMVAGVGLEDGIIETRAVDMDMNIFETHPMTGVQIKGFKIPYFKEAIDMVVEICEKKKIDGYIGWDMAITENGPVIIEVNASPGVRLLTMPYLAEGIGKKHEMRKLI